MTPLEKAAAETALETTSESAKSLIGKILGPWAENIGAMISDSQKPRLVRNQIRNFRKVQEIMQKEGVLPKEVNLKVLFPYLEGIALEEDETLQNIWANLFTNYIDSKKNMAVTVYPSILSQLSTDEVEILNHFERAAERVEINMTGEKKPHVTLSEPVANLVRLGLLEELPSFSQYPSHELEGRPQWNIESVASQEFALTDFGWNFIKACKR